MEAERKTELEYFVLALVGEDINSGYAVKVELQRIKGGRWSSQSGAVYRVLKRLFDEGLIRIKCKAGYLNRERTEYELTELGKSVVKMWVSETPSKHDLAVLIDPLRTRSYFLNRLNFEERGKVIKDWSASNRKLIQDLRKDIAHSPHNLSPLRKISYQNLILMAQARQGWLKDLYDVCTTVEDLLGDDVRKEEVS